VTVLALYEKHASGVIRVWERSWRKQGFTPGLISAKEHKKAPFPSILRRRRARLRLSPWLINFSFKRPRSKRVRWPIVAHGAPGWEKSPLVLFPEQFSESDILAARKV
jgi:hypothetical protein